MAEELKRPVGAVDALEIRRIGADHAVILPPRQATVLDVSTFRREAVQIARRLAALEEETEKLRALLADRQLIIDQFDAAKIDRIDGDPDVPQPAPPREADPAEVAVAVDRPAPVRGLRGG